MPNPPEGRITIGTRATAADLIRAGETAVGPSEQFRDEILRRLDASRRQGLDRPQALRALFPRTVLPTTTYDDLVTALVAGSHLLFFGPSGAGKTNLAKELWSIFPKEVWAVDGCPVLDHPLSVATDAGAARFPPCPICQRRF
ncbi:magnesium protoporphyrin chelatase, partial [mine drainage metagenome]